MKADKEQRDEQELSLAKRRHEELSRQQLMRDQAHRMQATPGLVRFIACHDSGLTPAAAAAGSDASATTTTTATAAS